MRIIISHILLLFAFAVTAVGQADTLSWYKGNISGSDTMAVVNLGQAVVSNNQAYANRYQKRYFRLEKKVLKVYPYAAAAGELMREYEAHLSQLKTERERKRYLKKAENELKEEFEGEIKDMTISEGLILIKLIDRETGDTSYELIRELRGSFSAFLWQSVARLFGSNLKEDYSPEEEDLVIENIIRRIENGDLKVAKREPKSSSKKKK